jgi:hypothetical protein
VLEKNVTPHSRAALSGLYSNTSPANSISTAATLVDRITPVGTPVERRISEDKTAITVNTLRVKKEKQDTTVMRETLNQSLKAFKATEGIEIGYTQL